MPPCRKRSRRTAGAGAGFPAAGSGPLTAKLLPVEARQHGEQAGIFVGLDEVAVGAQRESAGAVLLAAARGQEDDRQVAQPRLRGPAGGEVAGVSARALPID